MAKLNKMMMKMNKISDVRRDLFDTEMVPDPQLLKLVGPGISWNDNFWTIHPITRDLGDIIDTKLLKL